MQQAPRLRPGAHRARRCPGARCQGPRAGHRRDLCRNPDHSLIGWEVSHFGFNDYYGLFGDVAGTLGLDPAKPAEAKVDVTIPLANVSTASMGLTDHLLRAGKDGGKPDFFGPAPVPARFVTATIIGDLPLNGVTRPVTFEAETAIKRSDFGVSYAIPFVTDEVELDISVAFEKQ
ncbi:YceI family protein [Porphyrobacter sp. AAP82]|uniref:YceI family protein n=1 Tax=Porphyrobacter sp. AAP82 TaxID=1248917 RepID=UPI0002F5BFA3|nr:YceI family protein [Porphyrobacter sp. AAP82]